MCRGWKTGDATASEELTERSSNLIDLTVYVIG